jgi:ADP-Ribosyltransferase in polyvalent proteins
VAGSETSALLNQKMNTTVEYQCFPGSKVTDDNGELITVYHGTGAAISKFEDRLTFFTSSTAVASGYATRGGKGANVIAAHLNIKNPKKLDFLAPNTRSWYEKKRRSLIGQGFDGLIIGGDVFAVFWANQIRVL